jgi:RNA polymerase sigma-70 factor (ECF subfamily)
MEEVQYIKQVQQGNSAMFAPLVDKYQHYVFTVVFRVLKNRETAEEAAQDVFVKAFKRIQTYRFDAKFSTWLYPIARNTAIDYTRKKSHITASIDNDERFFDMADTKSSNSFARVKQLQRKEIIEQLINRLPVRDAELITLFYLKEQSIEEIAELLELSASNVKVKLFRLRKRLKKELDVMLNDEARELL